MERVARSTGLLFELIDMAFVDVCLLDGVKGFFVPYEVVEVVSDSVDVARDMCDEMHGTVFLGKRAVGDWPAGARPGRLTNAHSRVRIMVNSASRRVRVNESFSVPAPNWVVDGA